MVADARSQTVLIRRARRRDLPAIATFGDVVVHDTYDPLIGSAGAERTLEWWGAPLADAVASGLVHLAITHGAIVGVVERGAVDGEPVIWKLYVAASSRGRGIGPRLLQVAIADIGGNHERVLLEHLATNEAAAGFYERERFAVIRRDVSDDSEHDVVWRARPLIDREDHYASSGEFHEIHMGGAWRDLADVIADTFGRWSQDRLIVDVGAGSGAGVVALADHTECHIGRSSRASRCAR
ncbi:MAG: GNAT family N-acetyltransferase [Actinomycetota bacterium]